MGKKCEVVGEVFADDKNVPDRFELNPDGLEGIGNVTHDLKCI